MKKRIYRIDNFYSYDNNKNCLLIESNLEPNILSKIIVAIQFRFEDLVSYDLDIAFDHLLEILERFYKVKNVKARYKNILNLTRSHDIEPYKFNYIYKFDFKEIEVIKIEICSAREYHCSPNYRDLYKYLIKDKELNKMLLDYIKYPEAYKLYIKSVEKKGGKNA